MTPHADVPYYLCVFRATQDIADDVIDLGLDPDFDGVPESMPSVRPTAVRPP
jgi:hypothetical protein